MKAKTTTQAAAKQLSVLYDGNCPMCNYFTCSIDTKNEVNLINARRESPLRNKAVQMGLNINEGLIVVHNDTFYFGGEAVEVLLQQASFKGPLNLSAKIMLRYPRVIEMLYPIFVRIRLVLLRILGRPLISVHDTSRNTCRK